MTELDHDARRLLELTRQARTPSAADKVRVERLLGGALFLGATSAHAAGGGAASKLVGSALAAKWVGVAVLAVTGVAGYAGFRAWHAPRTPAVNVATDVAPSKADPESAPAAAAPEAAPTTVTPEELAPQTSGAADEQRPATAPSRSVGHGALPDELDLLHDAQAKWRAGNAQAALALLSEHRRDYPHSALAPERDALTILSLCATDRTAEARKLGRRFLQVAKHSPLRASVEESCGGK